MDLDELAQRTIEGRLSPTASERSDVDLIPRSPIVIEIDDDGEPILPAILRRTS